MSEKLNLVKKEDDGKVIASLNGLEFSIPQSFFDEYNHLVEALEHDRNDLIECVECHGDAEKSKDCWCCLGTGKIPRNPLLQRIKK